MKILIKPVLLEFSDEDRYYQQVPYSDFETEVLNILYDSDIKFDFEKFPNSIFVFKNDEFIFEYDIKYGILWCSYDKIWRFFHEKYLLNDLQITNLIKGVVEKHFINMEITPVGQIYLRPHQVEKHFKNIEIIPFKFSHIHIWMVEKHFKNMEITPLRLGVRRVEAVEEHFENMEVKF